MSKGLIPILQKKETEIEFPSNFFSFLFSFIDSSWRHESFSSRRT